MGWLSGQTDTACLISPICPIGGAIENTQEIRGSRLSGAHQRSIFCPLVWAADFLSETNACACGLLKAETVSVL